MTVWYRVHGIPASLLESCGRQGLYCWPRHQIGASGAVSFLGSGSQKYCTIRLHFSRSTPVISVVPSSLRLVCGKGAVV